MTPHKTRLAPQRQKVDLERLWTLVQATIDAKRALDAYLRGTPQDFQEAYRRASMSKGDYVRSVAFGDGLPEQLKGRAKAYLEKIKAFAAVKNQEKENKEAPVHQSKRGKSKKKNPQEHQNKEKNPQELEPPVKKARACEPHQEKKSRKST